MADTKISALTAVATPASTDEFGVNQSSTSKKMTLAQIATYVQGLSFTRISGSSGAAGVYKTTQELTANAAANSTTTLATVMTTTGLATGTYTFYYSVFYQSAATTTGVDFAIGFSGTASDFNLQSRFTSTGGTAATAIANGVTTNTANMVEGKGQRTLSTKIGSTLGVGTANVDQLMIIEGVLVVTASGNLTLQHCSEVAAASTIMAHTCLELTKIS